MSNTRKENPVNGVFNLSSQISNFAVDASTTEALCFAENLLICAKNKLSSDTKPIGGYCIAVEKIGIKSREFLVNIVASMNVEGCFASGSKLISTVTENFQSLEEKRIEFLHCPDGTYKKCLFIGSEDDSYHIEHENNYPCGSSSSSYDIPFETHSNLLSEAGNIILMRYLSLKNFHGSFSLQSVTIDGKIEACDYVNQFFTFIYQRCNSAEWKILDDKNLQVYSVERRIKNATDANENRQSKTLLTRQGRILRHDWLKFPFLLRINPLADSRAVDKRDTGVRQPLRDIWPQDFELLAKYFDRKTCTMAHHINYFESHLEIKKLMADYSQAILVVKPADVINFTIQYFKSFASNPESVEENISCSDD